MTACYHECVCESGGVCVPEAVTSVPLCCPVEELVSSGGRLDGETQATNTDRLMSFVDFFPFPCFHLVCMAEQSLRQLKYIYGILHFGREKEPFSKKVLGSKPSWHLSGWSFHILHMSAWVFYGCSCFFPPSKDMHTRVVWRI